MASLLAREDRAAELCAGDAWPEQTPEFDVSASEIVERRADVRAAAARLRQAEAAFQLARAQAKADITLGAQYERFPPDGRELLGFGFSLPLFVGERQEGAIRRANVERINAQASLERTRALAGSDIAAALNDYRSAVERLQRYRTELLPTAEKTAQAAEFARRQGALSLIDLLDARRTLRAVRLDGEQARADVAKAQAALTELTKPQESALP